MSRGVPCPCSRRIRSWDCWRSAAISSAPGSTNARRPPAPAPRAEQRPRAVELAGGPLFGAAQCPELLVDVTQCLRRSQRVGEAFGQLDRLLRGNRAFGIANLGVALLQGRTRGELLLLEQWPAPRQPGQRGLGERPGTRSARPASSSSGQPS